MVKLRLKRHGSFSIREGWFEKAIDSIKDNDKSVFGKENGVATLGIGANMVTSLRYWLIASEVIMEKNSMFTEFGKLLVEYDPYLDSDFSWWMIHQHLASNFKGAPIFNIVFNRFNIKNFTKETMNQFVLNYMQENGIDISNSSQVDADTTVLLKTYIKEKVKRILEEDKVISILGLLDNDKLIGFISLFKYDGDEMKNLTPWYATMYVKKEYRGNGYSKILNKAILNEARKRGFNKVYLKSDLNNYYEKFGAVYLEKLKNGEKLYYIDI